MVTSAATARLLRKGASQRPFEDGCGWSLKVSVGLDLLRLAVEKKHSLEETNGYHAG
jgi:hypothetical protein